MTSSLDLEVMSLVRTPDGFLTNLSRTVPVSAGVSEVFIFNPASNTNQLSSLRIINTSSQQGSVTIKGFDDTGAASSNVTFNMIGKSAISITSQELESGSSKFVGALGDGEGKWRLQITSNTALQVQSLLDTPTGFITNLSRDLINNSGRRREYNVKVGLAQVVAPLECGGRWFKSSRPDHSLRFNEIRL